MTGVGSIPALATCETSHVLLAGLSGGFPGILPFCPIFRLDRLDMSEISLKGMLNLIKKRLQFTTIQPECFKRFKTACRGGSRIFSNYYSTTTIHADVTTVLLRIIPVHHDLIKLGES